MYDASQAPPTQPAGSFQVKPSHSFPGAPGIKTPYSMVVKSIDKKIIHAYYTSGRANSSYEVARQKFDHIS
jgi:hypothetical protein